MSTEPAEPILSQVRKVLLPTQPRQSPKPIQERARTVVTGQVYHQSTTTSPVCVSSQWGEDLESTEQPYVRQVKVGPSWEQLDPGWLARVSLLVISNERPRFSGQPTKEQREEALSRVVEVGVLVVPPNQKNRTMHDPPRQEPFVVPFGEVKPGQDIRLRPVKDLPLTNLMLRCRNGTANVTVNLFPT